MSRSEPLFPYNSVVGVIDDPASLQRAVNHLAEAGFGEDEVGVLCGERGVERIDARGEHKGLLARVFRAVDNIGAEHDQTERHVEELQAGHYLAVVRAEDETAKLRARDVLVNEGAHYINYYSDWVTEELAP